jgi:hypothetical protein
VGAAADILGVDEKTIRNDIAEKSAENGDDGADNAENSAVNLIFHHDPEASTNDPMMFAAHELPVALYIRAHQPGPEGPPIPRAVIVMR